MPDKVLVRPARSMGIDPDRAIYQPITGMLRSSRFSTMAGVAQQSVNFEGFPFRLMFGRDDAGAGRNMFASDDAIGNAAEIFFDPRYGIEPDMNRAHHFFYAATEARPINPTDMTRLAP